MVTAPPTASTSAPTSPAPITTGPITTGPISASPSTSPAPTSRSVPTLASGLATTDTACVIKGNISRTGERIYHVPGQRDYDKTIITESKGERWFCTEAEAVAAGWRKSKV